MLQVSAGLLTYISVAMAYFPFAVQQMSELDETAPPVMPADTTVYERLVDSAAVAAVMDSLNAASGADSGAAATPEVTLTEADLRALRDENAPKVNPILGLVVVLGFAFALPILAILGSLPGGLISAAIIGFGIMQAWQLTGAPKLVFEGPFKLAGSGSGEGDRPT